MLVSGETQAIIYWFVLIVSLWKLHSQSLGYVCLCILAPPNTPLYNLGHRRSIQVRF